ncbi:unnamed protein product [Danaus chrysippus]|uniref:(African queen) hypothetical protein n=1 Tax=Danaus chrysippus TaxID=151541 RepID=A0A8J2W8P6_9NEOP|nr:unnamed protein product [Danaus chrysippus]
MASGDLERAKSLQEQLKKAVEAFTAEGPWVPALKAGMEIVTGIRFGPPALPQRPISEAARKRIEEKLRILKLIN